MSNSIVSKMRSSFQGMQGGLFSQVQKADVGDTAAKLKEQGVTLMCWADPFFPDACAPEHITKATVDALLSGTSVHYTAPIGNFELKVEIAKKLKAYNSLDVDPMRNVLITPGSDSGLFYAMLPFIEEGDEVMIIDPSYPNNFQNTQILGGKIVRIPVFAQNGYQFEIEEFEKRLSSKTKMIVLTNPNNPTTTVYNREKIEQLAKFTVENDLIMVVDQAFEMPVFDGKEMVSIASLDGMFERTLSVFSFSKGMGLSGYRVGYIVTSDIIMDKLHAAMVTVLGATNTAAQIGAIAALKDDSFMQRFDEIHQKRRSFVYDALHSIPGVKMLKPESGFLSWLDVSALGETSDILEYLVKEAKVLVNTGDPYGEQGKGHLRIVHGVMMDNDEWESAILRMRDALLKLSK